MSPSPSVPVLGSSASPPRRRAPLRTLQGAVFLGWGHRSRQGHGLRQGTREGVEAEVGALARSHESLRQTRVLPVVQRGVSGEGLSALGLLSG